MTDPRQHSAPSAARAEGPARPWILLAAAAGAAVQAVAWMSAGLPRSPVSGDAAERLRPEIAALLGTPESGAGAFVLGAFDVGLVLAVAWLAGRVARRLGLGLKPAAAAALLTALSPAAAAALADVAGRGLLLATLGLLGVLALEPGQERPSPTGRRVAQIGLAAVALWWSQGAMLPCLFLWFLLHLRGRTVDRDARLKLGALVVLILIPFLFLRSLLPPLGYGHALHEGMSRFAAEGGSPAPPGPPFLAAILAVLGVRADLPFLLPGWVPVAFSHLWSGLAVLLFLVAVIPARPDQRSALRFGGLAVLLSAFSAVLVAELGDASAVPMALLLPGAVGAAVLVAGLVQPDRRRRIPRWAPVVLVAFALLGAFSSLRMETAQAMDWFERAHQRDPGMPYAATQLAELRRASTGEFDPGPVGVAVLRAGDPPWPVHLEVRLGLEVTRQIQQARGAEPALEWMERWLGERGLATARSSFAQVRARRVQLLLECRSLDEAFAALDRDREELSDAADYLVAAALSLLEYLGAEPRAEADSVRLQDEAEELLQVGVRAPGAAGAEALLALSALRAGQGRFVEAIRCAEQAEQRPETRAAALVAQARVYLGTGQREAGLQRIARARQLDPDAAESSFMEGRLLAATPLRAEEAVEKMLGALAREPNLPRGWEECAESAAVASAALRTTGRPDKAEQVLQRVLAAMPPAAPVLVELARLALLRHDLDAAQDHYQRAFERKPEDPQIRKEYAELLRQRGYSLLWERKREQALPLFERVLELEPEGMPLDAMRAVVAAGAAAGEPAAHPSEEHTARARSAYQEGAEHYSAGKLEPAAESFRESIRLAVSNPLAHLQLGRILFELAVESGPEAARALGLLEEAAENLSVAIALGEAMEIDVEYAWLLLLRCLLGRDEQAESGVLMDRYRSRHPEGAYREQMEALWAGREAAAERDG